MNYSKLRNLLQEKNITIEKLCSDIGITRSGYHMMIKNDTMRINTLEKISKFLDVPVYTFFTDDYKNETSVSEDQQALNELVDQAHQKLMTFKEEQIIELKKEVKFLRKVIDSE